ncbi:MAG: GAF domain-containing protein [Actinomycetota bacterium]|nr:GAF domain-containing protein [Actinomycetota bacterium]
MRGNVDGQSWRDRLPHVLSDLGVGLVVAASDGAVVINEAFRTMTGYSTDDALALRPLGEIIAREPPEAIAQGPSVAGRYETEVLGKDGRRIPVAVSAQVAWCDGRREVVVTFRDLTDHRRAESELTVRARQQEVVAELGRQALVHGNPASLMDAAVTAVARTLGVDYVGILELVPEDGVLLLRAGAGWEDDLVGQATVPAGRGSPGGLTLDADGPVAVPDLARETRCAVPPLLADHGVVASACVVIRGVERPYGVLAADATCRRTFSADDVHFLRAVANVLADAIGQAQAEAALRAAHNRERRLRQRLEAHARRVVGAQESERRRIAHELHDEIGQALTGLKMTLEDYDRLPPASVAARMARARELTVDLLRRVQDLSLDLRPAMLDDLGLAPALVWLVERYTTQTAVEVALTCSGLEGRLDPQVETAAYRIVQEALTNIARHAGVKRATVDCSMAGTVLRVEVEDKGVGFDVDAVPVAASSGLVGMEERARSTGGRLSVRSAPGQGATLVAQLPISEPERAAP